MHSLKPITVIKDMWIPLNRANGELSRGRGKLAVLSVSLFSCYHYTAVGLICYTVVDRGVGQIK